MPRHRTIRAAAAALVTVILAAGALFSTPSTASAGPPYPCYTNQNLYRGHVNSCVKALQVYMNGYINANLAEDGIFGPATFNAVKAQQARLGALAVDGMVGPATRARMCRGDLMGIPDNSGASRTKILRAASAIHDMCWGFGFTYW
jgi:hypothetical protein